GDDLVQAPRSLESLERALGIAAAGFGERPRDEHPMKGDHSLEVRAGGGVLPADVYLPLHVAAPKNGLDPCDRAVVLGEEPLDGPWRAPDLFVGARQLPVDEFCDRGGGGLPRLPLLRGWTRTIGGVDCPGNQVDPEGPGGPLDLERRRR